MIDLYADIDDAKRGREIWLRIKGEYSFEPINDCLIILPSREIKLNQAALRDIPDYMRRKYLHKAIVVSSTDMSLIESMQEPAEGRQIFFKQLEQIQCEQLLKYYRLTQFTKNIIVVSLEEPYGNGNIIGKEGITLEDYIRNAIFV